ncbi:C2H2-type zinc finger protein [Klebsiella quasipneumoniae]|uniref:C2H2-type zinc finger protein n=1 Tax=Klebsiella quasipneumoniae TaxID=1463165 RepID=UPI001D0FB86D|nr:C2H2-type zinc finger protein [Klebsiella quasipneumoniae]
MEELFTCPICKLSFGHKARLRKHIKKHTKSLEKNLAKANSTKKAEHEKMLIQERIARTGSAFKNESERNKYFEREGANKQVISSQADSLIKISRIWADFFPANTSNQPI